MAEPTTIQPTYTIVEHDTPAGPRWYVVNESAPGNTRKYLASFETEAEAEAEAAERNRPAGAVEHVSAEDAYGRRVVYPYSWKVF